AREIVGGEKYVFKTRAHPPREDAELFVREVGDFEVRERYAVVAVRKNRMDDNVDVDPEISDRLGERIENKGPIPQSDVEGRIGTVIFASHDDRLIARDEILKEALSVAGDVRELFD